MRAINILFKCFSKLVGATWVLWQQDKKSREIALLAEWSRLQKITFEWTLTRLFIKNFSNLCFAIRLRMPEYKLKECDTRQSILIKNSIRISSLAHSSVLFESLQIKSFTEIYNIHKVSFFSQIQQYPLIKHIFMYLNDYYQNVRPNKASFFHQLSKLTSRTKLVCSQEK